MSPGRLLLMWTLFFGLYLLLALQWQLDELIAGAVVAGAITAWLVLIRRRSEARFVVRWQWFALLARRLPGRVLADCAVLLRAFGRAGNAGEFCAVPFDKDSETRPGEAAARRALVIAGASLAPNSLVVAVDARRERLLVHQLIHTPKPPGNGDRLWPL